MTVFRIVHIFRLCAQHIDMLLVKPCGKILRNLSSGRQYHAVRAFQIENIHKAGVNKSGRLPASNRLDRYFGPSSPAGRVVCSGDSDIWQGPRLFFALSFFRLPPDNGCGPASGFGGLRLFPSLAGGFGPASGRGSLRG